MFAPQQVVNRTRPISCPFKKNFLNHSLLHFLMCSIGPFMPSVMVVQEEDQNKCPNKAMTTHESLIRGRMESSTWRSPHVPRPHRCSVVLDHKIQPTLFKLSFFPFLSPGQWSQARITRFKQLLSNWQLWNCPSFKRSALELSFFQALNFVLLSYCQLWNHPCHCQRMYWSIVDPKLISNWKKD